MTAAEAAALKSCDRVWCVRVTNTVVEGAFIGRTHDGDLRVRDEYRGRARFPRSRVFLTQREAMIERDRRAAMEALST